MYNAMWQKVLKSETISIDANSEIFTQGVCTCFTKSQHFQNKSPYFWGLLRLFVIYPHFKSGWINFQNGGDLIASVGVLFGTPLGPQEIFEDEEMLFGAISAFAESSLKKNSS